MRALLPVSFQDTCLEYKQRAFRAKPNVDLEPETDRKGVGIKIAVFRSVRG